MNTPLLTRVKNQILALPTAFCMADWIAPGGEETDPSASDCGTVACIAGWAYLLDATDKNGAGWTEVAQELLLIDPAPGHTVLEAAERLLDVDNEQAGRLFFAESWPEPFSTSYQDLTSSWRSYLPPLERSRRIARVAADRIDHFMVTNGAA